MQSPFGVLRVRNFRLHFGGQIISNAGTWFQSLAQALLIVELTESGKALGVVTALQFTPALLLGLYGGALADRLRPRAVLMATSGIAALLAIALATVTAMDRVTVPWVCAIAFALGCVQALGRPAAQAFLYELVGPDDLSSAIGLHSITQSSARMAGPALGGAAYSLLGSAACFAINGVSFLFVVLSLLLMRVDQLWPRGIAASEPGQQVWHGVRYALRHPDLRAPLLVNLLIGCLAFNFMITITAMVRFELDGGAGALGAAHALNAAGSVLGSLLIASLARPPSRAVLALACCAMAVTILVNAISPNLLTFLVWAPVFGLSIGAYQTAMLTLVQRATEPAMLGRMSALLVFGSVGMTPIGSLITGWLIDAWSARAAMGLGAVACLLGALALARPSVDRSARPTPAAP
jgi:MFS family permease